MYARGLSRGFFCVALLLPIVAQLSPASAALISGVSNLGNPQDGWQTVQASTFYTRPGLSQQFVTGPSGGNLQELAILVQDGGVVPGPNGRVSVRAHIASTGLPRLTSTVATSTGPFASQGNQLWTIPLTAVLAPNTTYWIEFETTSTVPFSYRVAATNTLTETGMPGWSLGPVLRRTVVTEDPFFGPFTTTWDGPYSNFAIMMDLRIEAVPEPSSLALAAAGAGAVGLALSRRRRTR